MTDFPSTRSLSLITRSGPLVLAATLAGCVPGVDADDASNLGNIGTAVVVTNPCGDLCPPNSATVGQGIRFFELDGTWGGGQQNSSYLQIKDFWKGDDRYEPLIYRDQLFGIPHDLVGPGGRSQPTTEAGTRAFISDVRRDGRLLEGAMLEGAEFEITYEPPPGVLPLKGAYLLRIEQVGTAPYWSAPTTGEHGLSPAYMFMFRRIGDDPDKWQPICKTKDEHDDPMQRFGAFVFRGDRYDSDTITVTGGEMRWFNVACFETAIGKMHAMRHTEAGTPRHRPPTPEPTRNAVLKMLTADYCGVGESFTKDGQPLHWDDRVGFSSYNPNADYIEAVWSETGAVCMNWPRISQYRDDIYEKCASVDHDLPRCEPISSYPGAVYSALVPPPRR